MGLGGGSPGLSLRWYTQCSLKAGLPREVWHAAKQSFGEMQSSRMGNPARPPNDIRTPQRVTWDRGDSLPRTISPP